MPVGSRESVAAQRFKYPHNRRSSRPTSTVSLRVKQMPSRSDFAYRLRGSWRRFCRHATHPKRSKSGSSLPLPIAFAADGGGSWADSGARRLWGFVRRKLRTVCRRQGALRQRPSRPAKARPGILQQMLRAKSLGHCGKAAIFRNSSASSVRKSDSIFPDFGLKVLQPTRPES